MAAGQRLFHLAIAGRRPLTIPGRSGRRRVRRLFHINVTLDAPQDQIRVCIYISEVKAQKLAVRLRQQSHAGTLTVSFSKIVARRLPVSCRGTGPGGFGSYTPKYNQDNPLRAVLQKLPALVPQVFITKMQEWLVHGFSEFIKTQSPKFLAATEDPADGVTLRFTIEHPED